MRTKTIEYIHIQTSMLMYMDGKIKLDDTRGFSNGGGGWPLFFRFGLCIDGGRSARSNMDI